MKEEKACPLRCINHEWPSDCVCGEEKCAWWSKWEECCVILQIANCLIVLDKTVTEK